MSETNTTEQATVETNGEAATPCKMYATKAEAEAAKPADAPKTVPRTQRGVSDEWHLVLW